MKISMDLLQTDIGDFILTEIRNGELLNFLIHIEDLTEEEKATILNGSLSLSQLVEYVNIFSKRKIYFGCSDREMESIKQYGFTYPRRKWDGQRYKLPSTPSAELVDVVELLEQDKLDNIITAVIGRKSNIFHSQDFSNNIFIDTIYHTKAKQLSHVHANSYISFYLYSTIKNNLIICAPQLKIHFDNLNDVTAIVEQNQKCFSRVIFDFNKGLKLSYKMPKTHHNRLVKLIKLNCEIGVNQHDGIFSYNLAKHAHVNPMLNLIAGYLYDVYDSFFVSIAKDINSLIKRKDSYLAQWHQAQDVANYPNIITDPLVLNQIMQRKD